LGDRTRIPSLVEGVDIRKLPIGPEEAFLLSRIDGRSGSGELAIGLGFEETHVVGLLDKLHGLGAITYPDGPEVKAPQEVRVARPLPVTENAASATPARATSPIQDEGGARSLAELDRLLQRLQVADHYQVLGLARGAAKAEAKAAYFSIIGRYHPDRYFGADLAETKERLKRIVARLTDAYDTLTRGPLRVAYDETLGELPPSEANLGMSASAAPSIGHETLLPEAPGASLPTSPVVPEARLSHAAGPKRGTDSIAANLDSSARQRALARMLSGSSVPGRRSSMSLSAMPSAHSGVPSPTGVRAPSSTGLPFAATVPAMPSVSAAGSSALGELNALKVALARTPDDPILQRRLHDAQLAADLESRDRLKLEASQAKAAGRMRDATILYERAARAWRSPELYLEAARCSVAASENPRRSAEFAKGGLALAPDHAALHSMLGRIYADAGMTKSALSSLERARQLDPSDETVKALLERVKNS
jgi:curved DNA-binding protein CbpA